MSLTRNITITHCRSTHDTARKRQRTPTAIWQQEQATWPRGYNFFNAQLNWVRNFNWRKLKKFLALSLSDVVFIMLINVKMPTIVGILTFMSRINFVLSWVEYDFFYNHGTSFLFLTEMIARLRKYPKHCIAQQIKNQTQTPQTFRATMNKQIIS